jgi:hypothetical protein
MSQSDAFAWGSTSADSEQRRRPPYQTPISHVESLRFSSLQPSLSGQQANALSLNSGTGVLKGKSMRPESFAEGSKNVRHLPCYLSIQRKPEFFSAYHH